ncbi:N-acetylmuramate alpha-1-phosphate uridylyltransferase MurU [Marinobacter orientalis]|uniref:Nucleotidyltransferase family protein n=1 Tax=Marinobacter orientalis TaxID=1928859 RepID=A0A7Y0RAQ9_9GAMM|nr:nucleotidyltransferase family protein [Marinobacter orientalis]NMT62417.1 nucleotidyltransferase family protein [Marinobacter orientalis]TGX51117.1 nucleotidyltransferase family protein [Marinobacter orientalis]
MKAMILAAGRGERMRPLTLTTPKPLLPAGDKPLIVHHLERLKTAGFRQLVINHAWLGMQIEEALGSGDDCGLAIEYSRESEPLETAGGIIQALPLLTRNGNDWFVVVNGDIWCDFDPAQLAPPDNADALLVMTRNPDHNPAGDFCLHQDGTVSAEGPDMLTFSGISLLNRRLFDGLVPGPRRLAPILREAMARKRVRGLYHSGQWMDIGTPERLRELDRKLKEGED